MRYNRMNYIKTIVEIGEEFQLGKNIYKVMQTTPKGVRFMNTKTNRYVTRLFNDLNYSNITRPRGKKTFKIKINKIFWGKMKKMDIDNNQIQL